MGGYPPFDCEGTLSAEEDTIREFYFAAWSEFLFSLANGRSAGACSISRKSSFPSAFRSSLLAGLFELTAGFPRTSVRAAQKQTPNRQTQLER